MVAAPSFTRTEDQCRLSGRIGRVAASMDVAVSIDFGRPFMRRFLMAAGAVLAIGGVSATGAIAASPGTQGQPNQSCQTVFPPPGLLTPPGFNTAGFANAGNNYAGTQPQNSKNPNSVAQYDVACIEAGQRP
jgi:hypothetical protein